MLSVIVDMIPRKTPKILLYGPFFGTFQLPTQIEFS